MFNMELANPQFLYLWIIIPLMVIWFMYYEKKMDVKVKMPGASIFYKNRDWLSKLRPGLLGLRLLGLGLLIFALARPRTHELSEKTFGDEGIDIIMAMDISGSMKAEDFKPNRLEASKEVALKFVENRPNDRLGLVVYSGESFTQCPLTLDHSIVKNLLTEININMIEDQSTAIGMGLATGVSRLKDSKAKSKVIILLTDGVNNSGFISPATAAEIATKFDIRVYTIGVGSYGKAPYPFQGPFGIQYQNIEVKIDEDILKQIAQETGGKYFRANTKNKLKTIYDEIDKMEKTEMESISYQRYEEKYFVFLLIGSVLLFAELFFRSVVLKGIYA